MSDSPWDGLASDTGRRIDSHGRCDFFWVRLPDGAPGLLLKLIDGVAEIHPLPKLRNLSLFYRMMDGRNNLCIRLADRGQVDLFETFCRDVVAAAEAAETSVASLGRALQRTLRWHHLLRGGSPDGLSLEEQRGLVAELAVLRDLRARFGAPTAIEAWKGPEGSAKDFELPGILVEVKARRGAAHPKVTISSEAQLSPVQGFDFFLRVVDVDTALGSSGQTLADHVDATAALFTEDQAALDLWEQRLAATGYDANDVDERRTWRTGRSRTYEVRPGFPRLIPPLPEGVADLRYSISLNACAPYEVAEDALSPARVP